MDPVTIAALIGAGADIFGGLLGSSSAKSQNKAAAELSREQMQFQERMSSTAHQREVEDLRAAGLNPILSAHGGASSPSGSMAPVVSTGEPMQRALSSSAARVMEMNQLKANVNLANESAKTQMSQRSLNAANAAKSIAEAKYIGRGKLSIPGFYSGYTPFSAKDVEQFTLGGFTKEQAERSKRNLEIVRRQGGY